MIYLILLFVKVIIVLFLAMVAVAVIGAALAYPVALVSGWFSALASCYRAPGEVKEEVKNSFVIVNGKLVK